MLGVTRTVARRGLRARLTSAVTSVALVALGLVALAPAAQADGALEFTASLDAPETSLQGATIDVTLTARNPSTTPAYNTSFRLVLPTGVSLDSSTPAPTSSTSGPGAGETTLVWMNVADLLGGSPGPLVSIPVTLAVASTVALGDVDLSGQAFASTDARLLPVFDADGVASGSHTASEQIAATVELVPFTLSKALDASEGELLRGVHDHRARVDLTIDNNLVGASTSFQIVDYIPATLEFLGCGEPGADGDTDVDGDNSAVGTEEYAGSGRLNASSFGLAAGTCPEPTSVETQTLDLDGTSGPQPEAVYTVVTWDSSALGTATGTDLSSAGGLGAGDSATISYVVGVPERANVDSFAATVGTAGEQASNLDNNTGSSTIELDGDEQGATNLAVLTGDYDDPNASGGVQEYTDSGTESTSLEDVWIQKSVDDGTIVQGQTSTWTLVVRSSEYTTGATDIVVTDTVPDGLEVLAGSSTPTPTSVTENAAGSTTVVWSGAATDDLGRSDTQTFTLDTRVRDYYRQDGADDFPNPVRANDSWTNSVEMTAQTVDRDGTDRVVQDVSSAGQSAESVDLTKQVAAPDGSGQCDDGSGLAWEPSFLDGFTPGDYVCWRITIETPSGLDTQHSSLTDFLPVGFEYESSVTAPGSTITFPAPVVTGSAITWDLSGTTGSQDAGSTSAVVIRSKITDASAGEDGDILGNLAKLAYQNTIGTVFQLRAGVDAGWVEPQLTLDKAATPTTGLNGGETVAYTLTIPNSGSEPALDVEIWDNLPAQIDCAQVSALTASGPTTVAFTCSAGRISGTLTSIAGDSTATVTYTVTIPSTVNPGDILTNTAGVRGYNGATNDPADPFFEYVPDDNIDPTQTPNADPADDAQSVTVSAIGLTKSATSPVETGNTTAQATIGEIVTYTVVATIPAGTTSYDATVVDVLPTGLTYLGTTSATCTAPAGCTITPQEIPASGQTVAWFLGDPPVDAANQVVTIVYTARVADVAANVAGATKVNGARLAVNDTDVLTATPATPPATTSFSQRTSNVTTTTTVVEPRITLTKAHSDANSQVDPGESIDFDLVVGNAAGASVAHDVVVVDVVPGSMTPVLDGSGFVQTSGGLLGLWDDTDPANRTITWTISSIAAGASVTLDYTVVVADPIPSPSSYTNTAAATTTSLAGTPTGERGYTDDTAPSATRYRATAAVTLDGPDPSIAKASSPTSAAPGDEVDYTLTVTVPANVQTYAVVRDVLPAGLELVSQGGSTCDAGGSPCSGADAITATALTPSGQTIGWLLGSITDADVERTVTLTYTARITGPSGTAVDGDVLTNTAELLFEATTPGTPPASVTDIPGLGLDGSDTASADLDVVEPTIELTKTVGSSSGQTQSRRVTPGETVTYTIILTNTGNAAAYDVVVADTTDPRFAPITDVTGATVTDADPAGDGSLAFTVSDIAAGASVTITYEAVVPDPLAAATGPELVNVADATYSSLAGDRTGVERLYDDVVEDSVELEADVASLGDTVWFDTNANGVQEAGELGVQGVTVTVTYLGPDGVLGGGDDEVHVTTTDADGAYLVQELPQGAYLVVISDVPAGTANTYDEDSGTTSPDGQTAVTLADSDAYVDADFGIRGSGTVGDTVWLDHDGDGTQDAGEPGLGGVDVTVSWPATNGQPAGSVTTTTAADGTWSVTGIPAADVTVTLDPDTYPSGTELVSEFKGGTLDGTSTDALAAGATDNAFDFGLRGTGSIGDRIWVDDDRDGVQDAGEPGIPGAVVQVRWLGADGISGTADDLVVTTTTGDDGLYLVDGLPAGDFEVTIVSLPVSLAPTYDEDGGTASPNGATEVTLAAGEAHDTADFGYVAETGVGDTIWLDLDGDGVQDAGEPGISGVEVTVTVAGADGALGTADDIVRTATTDEDGYWLVVGLPAGPARVEVTDGLPDGVSPTYDADGTGTPGLSELTLVENVVDDLQDFGYVGANGIGDTVWLDLDADGLQDGDEPGLAGVEIQVTWFGQDGLEGTTDDVTLPATTDADGVYLVDGLPNGDYSVVVASGVPDGWAPSYDETGDADGLSTVIALGADGPEDHLTADFGYAGTGGLCGMVWLDLEADGVLDEPSETTLPGIVVNVTWAGPDGVLGTADDVVFTAETDADGSWCVENMPPGAFTVGVDPTTLPEGSSVVWDLDSGLISPDGLITGVLEPGELLTGLDMAVRGSSSIGDLVWVDENGNGTRDPGEPGAGDVLITLTCLGDDGFTVQVRTESDGSYLVDGLPACTYQVTFDPSTFPTGTTAYSDLDGGDETVTTVDLGIDEDRTDVDLVLRRSGLATTGAAISGLLALSLLLTGAGVFLRRRSARLGAEVA